MNMMRHDPYAGAKPGYMQPTFSAFATLIGACTVGIIMWITMIYGALELAEAVRESARGAGALEAITGKVAK